MLQAPNDLVLQAFKRLRHDQDCERVLDWLRQSLQELDKRNRTMVDGVQLRMGQGAGVALATIIDAAEGRAQARAQGVIPHTGRQGAAA